MRAEVAVCLLAEVAYEHDEDFRGHLPLLFHAMLLLMDSTDSLVFRHAQQVVTHLLYSLSVRHLEIHRAAGELCFAYGVYICHPRLCLLPLRASFGTASSAEKTSISSAGLLDITSTIFCKMKS